MTYKIKEIMDWWSKFNNIDIELKTENNLFFIKLNDEQLPHLLGLQYITENRGEYIGKRLYKYCYDKSDEELFTLIKENNIGMLQSVSDRIDTFQYFMENLERGILVENTKERTNIRSQHFIVEYNDSKVLHLGLLNVAGEDAMIEYGVIDKKLETYILSNNDGYFKDSIIKEKIQSIARYSDSGELEPFSFKIYEHNILEYDIDDEGFSL